jgi:hypothetical protein
MTPNKTAAPSQRWSVWFALMGFLWLPGLGCTARTILKEGDYGIVAIPYNSNAWPHRLRNQAHDLMSAHFPNGYEVIREEEYVVGQTTHFDEERVGGQVAVIDDIFSIGTSRGRGSATTSPQTEYRFHYRSRDPGYPGSPAALHPSRR